MRIFWGITSLYSLRILLGIDHSDGTAFLVLYAPFDWRAKIN